MNKKPGMKVFAPASVGNLGVGFDILGLAIEGLGDEIIFKEGESEGVKISSIHGDGGKLPRGLNNTALYAAQRVLEASGHEGVFAELEIFKKMPFGAGMGSSAASAVAGAFGMNEYLGQPFTREQLLLFAVQGEQQADGAFHADNVAPSLFGGIILSNTSEELNHIKLPVPRGLSVALIYPKVKLLTKQSRAVLSETVLLKDHIVHNYHLAAFVAGLFKSDFEIIRNNLKDIIIEPQRAHLIPKFYAVKESALELGALGFSISGAGSTMFALCNNTLTAERIIEKARSIYHNEDIDCEFHISSVNQKGAYKF